jgi:hypothetical protein
LPLPAPDLQGTSAFAMAVKERVIFDIDRPILRGIVSYLLYIHSIHVCNNLVHLLCSVRALSVATNRHAPTMSVNSVLFDRMLE